MTKTLDAATSDALMEDLYSLADTYTAKREKVLSPFSEVLKPYEDRLKDSKDLDFLERINLLGEYIKVKDSIWGDFEVLEKPILEDWERARNRLYKNMKK